MADRAYIATRVVPAEAEALEALAEANARRRPAAAVAAVAGPTKAAARATA
jgi:hypothetical protein